LIRQIDLAKSFEDELKKTRSTRRRNGVIFSNNINELLNKSQLNSTSKASYSGRKNDLMYSDLNEGLISQEEIKLESDNEKEDNDSRNYYLRRKRLRSDHNSNKIKINI
jgi:hypothetical protein